MRTLLVLVLATAACRTKPAADAPLPSPASAISDAQVTAVPTEAAPPVLMPACKVDSDCRTHHSCDCKACAAALVAGYDEQCSHGCDPNPCATKVAVCRVGTCALE